MPRVELEQLLPVKLVNPAHCPEPGVVEVARATIYHDIAVVVEKGIRWEYAGNGLIRVPALNRVVDKLEERRLVADALFVAAGASTIMQADSMKRLKAGLQIGIGSRVMGAVIASQETARVLEPFEEQEVQVYIHPQMAEGLVLAVPAMDRGFRLIFPDKRSGMVLFGPVAQAQFPLEAGIKRRTSWERLDDEG